MVKNKIKLIMEKLNNNKILLWLTLLLYTIIISYVSVHHELWSDEWHVWFMCHDLNIPRIIRSMPNEGHFCLWHLCIYPFVKMGFGFGCLKVVSCVLCIIGAWFLLFKAPFNYIIKVLVLYSFPMLYSFPVLPRCYALIPPIAFAMCFLYRKLPDHKYLYCFFVGLLAHTHVYMEGFVAALFLLYCYEHIYLPRKNGQTWTKNIYPALVTLFVVFCAFIQVFHSKTHVLYHSERHKQESVDLLSSIFYYNSFQPTKRFIEDNNIEFPIPNFDLSLTALLWIIVIIALYKCFWTNKFSRKYAVTAFLGISWMFMFATTIYHMSVQRIYLPFFVIIILLWFSYSKQIKKYINYALVSLFILTTYPCYVLIPSDVVNLASNGEKVSEYIHENIELGSVLAMNHHEFYIYELLGKDYTWCDLEDPDGIYTDELLDPFIEEHPCDVFYAICKDRTLEYKGEKYQMKCIYDGFKEVVISKRFSVYKVEKKKAKVVEDL